jgi:hypothetical protein
MDKPGLSSSASSAGGFLSVAFSKAQKKAMEYAQRTKSPDTSPPLSPTAQGDDKDPGSSRQNDADDNNHGHGMSKARRFFSAIRVR